MAIFFLVAYEEKGLIFGNDFALFGFKLGVFDAVVDMLHPHAGIGGGDEEKRAFLAGEALYVKIADALKRLVIAFFDGHFSYLPFVISIAYYGSFAILC